ncbi:MAG: RNA polymerase sigma factor [Ferruginibacter sp.]
MTESELIIRLREGNEEAFRELVTTYRDPVYNTVLSIVQQREDAQDIAQDVFIIVFRSVQHFAGNSTLSTWIYRIAVNSSLDHLRRKKRRKRFGFILQLFGDENEQVPVEGDFNHPGVQLEQKENAAILFLAVKQLPKNQQVAFLLNKTEGLSYSEVGDIMGISEAATDGLLQRAKQNLRKMLNKKSFFTKAEGFSDK